MSLQNSFAALPLTLALALAACGSPQAEQDGETETSMTQEPGVDGTDATAGQAMSEAQALAGRLAAGNMDRSETAVALEDLDQLVNNNIIDFPEAIRPKLTQDISSARSAFEAQDAQGLQEAATSIQTTLSTSEAVGQNN